MYEFRWLTSTRFPPNGTLEDGIALAKRLEWNIRWGRCDQAWCVWAGEDLILRADSKEVAEAFLYGLGLAYAVLQVPVFRSLERNVQHWIEGEALEP